MKKYLICLRSIIALIWCKLVYRSAFRLGGIPVSVKTRNIMCYQGGAISVGPRLNIYGNTEIVSIGGVMTIGRAVFLNSNCNIVCRKSIKIGDRCRFGPNVCIYDHDHMYGNDGVTDDYKLGSVTIGNNCWVGANSVILRDSIIGDGCVIGAGVVFKGNLPPHSIVFNDKNNLTIKSI